MAQINTDLTEEDAADLQFPKGPDLSEQPHKPVQPPNRSAISHVIDTECVNCCTDLFIPHISCNECDVNICIQCFARGAEFLEHKNNHSYLVVNDNFVLFKGSNWTAKEELILLNGLLDYGNFNAVAKQLKKRNAQEVKQHYDYYYLERNGSELLPMFSDNPRAENICPTIPYRFVLSNVEDPPRYAPNSIGYHNIAGYNAARSDFELKYDTNAEDLIANLNYDTIEPDNPLSELLANLQCSIVQSYNRRLWERQKRKAIIRNHGLILLRKTVAWLHRYDGTISRSIAERMCRFMQFCNGTQFEYLMEGLHRRAELKQEINRLCEFRAKGIKTLESAELYLHLKQRREESMADVKKFQANPSFKIKSKCPISTLPTGKKRGGSNPLDITGMPGYERLTDKELELCKTARLVPLSYLELKDILIVENKKFGHLKLQTARRLLKIDVNKTRKIYDFLVQEGYVSPN